MVEPIPSGGPHLGDFLNQRPCLLLVDLVICDLGTLTIGATATVELDDAPAALRGAAFAASVSGDQSDPVTGNDSDGLVVDVLPTATATPTPTPGSSASGSVSGSLPESSLSIWTPGGIGALPLVFSAWVLLLLTLAVVTARGQGRRR